MKYFAVALLLTLSIGAQAASIANCPAVEHHGQDVELKDDNGKITLTIYNDGGDETQREIVVTDIKKNGVKLANSAAASWAIRQAIKGSKEVDQSGVIAIKAKIKGQSVLINLNTYAGGNFLVDGDYVYQLNCQ